MFTGIVEERGTVIAVVTGAASAVLSVRGPTVTADLRPGDSVAVNGVCLTAVRVEADRFAADVMAETLARSSLGALSPGEAVNLERAVTPSTRLGGHLVQGHVDGVGVVLERIPGERWEAVRISLPAGLDRYIVEKGSIAVDGVSLTVVSVDQSAFTVGLIPATLEATTLGAAGPGSRLNLEVDVLAKYVEKMLTPHIPEQP